MLGSAQSKFGAASSLTKPSAEAPVFGRAKLKNNQLAAKRSWQMALRQLAPYLITLVVGVAVTLTWQTYGHTARNMIASVASSPNKQQFSAIPLNLDAMRQSIDGLITSIATNHGQIMRSVDQVAASQEQMTRNRQRAVCRAVRPSQELRPVDAADAYSRTKVSSAAVAATECSRSSQKSLNRLDVRAV